MSLIKQYSLKYPTQYVLDPPHSWQTVRESGIHVVFNALENSKTERGGLNFVDTEKYLN